MGVPYDLFRLGLRGLFALLWEPLTYCQDGLYTIHNADFLTDPDFARAYRIATESYQKKLATTHIEWRVYVCCWAATQALRLEGDFVECGVNTGMYSRAITEYTHFESQSRRFYLLDTFEGMPADQFLAEEVAKGLRKRYVYGDVFELTKRRFERYPNIVFVKGFVPDTLPAVPSERIAYLSIDMNAVVPEIAAITFFWEKLVPGGMVVLDDYGWRQHIVQKRAFDLFAKQHGVMILSLPTGQGLIIKP